MYTRAFYVFAVIVTIHLRVVNDLRASVKRTLSRTGVSVSLIKFKS